MQGRAPRAQPTAPQARGTRARPPSPAIISAWVRAAGEHDEGKGGAPRGRGGGRGTTRRETERPALPHADQTPRNRRRKRPEARRGRAGRTQRPRASPSRGRTGERGQRPSRPDRRRRGGQRARELLHLHHAHQRRRDHASGRRRGGEAGGDGAGRAALGRRSKPPTPCHQRRKTPRKDAQAASATDAEREGQGAPANPPELLGLHPLGRGRTRQKRGAAARRPLRQTQQPPPPKQPPPDHTPAACGGKRILGRRQALGMG